MSKPVWKIAQEQQEEYKKHGIKYCYNQRNHNVYLSVLEAPYSFLDNGNCQLVGWLTLYGGVHAASNIKKYAEEVKREFIRHWKNYPDILKCADTIII